MSGARTAAAPQAMSGSRQRQPAGLDSLPSDLLQRVAQLGFLSQVSPFWDRGDLLQQAASLACVGNASFSEFARILFAGPSPRLGERTLLREPA